MPIDSSNYLQQASIFSDLNSLDSIRQQGLSDQQGAIKKAAKEFEAFFLKMMLKSMRQASEVIGENNLIGSHQEKMFTGMMDDQLAVDLSQRGDLGIAQLMVEQFNRTRSSSGSEDAGAAKEDRIESKSLVDYLSNPIQKSNLFKKQVVSEVISSKSNQRNSLVDSIKVNPELKLDSGLESSAEKENAIESKEAIFPTVKASDLRIIDRLPEKKSLFDSAKDFAETLYPIAKEVAKKINLDPKVLLAQAALETGWGKFVMHDNKGSPGFNLFGIKANSDWKGSSIEIGTLEVENQIVKKVKAQFRQYQSFLESFEDYAKFITSNGRYQKAVEATDKPEAFVQELQDAGYATDPQYANKIMRIFSKDVIQNVGASD